MSALFPDQFTVGYQGSLIEMDPREYDKDPRGVVWMYEPPNRYSSYVMGVDPALGRTGWSRYGRVKEDLKTNNGAIEIIRIGRNHSPDVQVCEFMAPVDAFELGVIANILGRVYAGMDEDGQCKCILETYPGPGGMTYRQMTELGYMNHWTWEYYADATVTPSKSIGWTATPKSLRDLWVKCSRHIILHNAIIRSPFLAEQYADARYNPDKGYAESPNNRDGTGHGDALRAFNLALWCARGWSMDAERTREPVTTHAPIDPQFSDMTMDEVNDRWAMYID